MDQPNSDEVMRWFKEVPGYRQLIKQRVHEAQKRVMMADNKRERRRGNREDVDKLGQEVDGCG